MNRSPLNLFPKRFSSPVLWTKVSLFNRARTATVRTSGIAGSCLRSIFNDRARWGGSQLFLDELYQNSFVKHEKRVDNFITTQSLKLCQEQRRNALVAKDGTVFCNGLRGMKLLPQTQTIMRCYYNVVFMSTAVKSRDGRMCNGETAAAENKDEFASRKDNRDYRLPAEIPDFSNSHLAHGDKSMMELVRGILVLNTCRIGFIVNNSKALLKWSYRLFGSTITDTVLKHTFFKHFCAGETSQSMRPQIERMRSVGNVYSILDYAAESDDRGSSNQDADSSAQSSSKNQARESAPKDSSENANEDLNNAGGHNEKLLPVHNLNQPARVYTYQSEQGCDEHRDNFLSCIDAVSDVSPERGFAAIKVSALGNPVLLERMSSAIVEARKLYERFDGNNDGIVTRDEFSEGYR